MNSYVILFESLDKHKLEVYVDSKVEEEAIKIAKDKINNDIQYNSYGYSFIDITKAKTYIC